MAVSVNKQIDWYRIAVLEAHVLTAFRRRDVRVRGIHKYLNRDNKLLWYFTDASHNPILFERRDVYESLILDFSRRQLHWIILDASQAIWTGDEYMLPAWQSAMLSILPLDPNAPWLIEGDLLTLDLSRHERASERADDLSQVLTAWLLKWWRQGALPQSVVPVGYQFGPITNVSDYVVGPLNPVDAILQQFAYQATYASNILLGTSIVLPDLTPVTPPTDTSVMRVATVALLPGRNQDLRAKSLSHLVRDLLQLSDRLTASVWKVETDGQRYEVYSFDYEDGRPLLLDRIAWRLLNGFDWRWADTHLYVGQGTLTRAAIGSLGAWAEYPNDSYWLVDVGGSNDWSDSADVAIHYLQIREDAENLSAQLMYLGDESQAASSALKLQYYDFFGALKSDWYWQTGQNARWLANNRMRVANGQWPLFAWAARTENWAWQLAACQWILSDAISESLRTEIVMLNCGILLMPAPNDQAAIDFRVQWEQLLDASDNWQVTPIEKPIARTSTTVSVVLGDTLLRVDRAPFLTHGERYPLAIWKEGMPLRLTGS